MYNNMVYRRKILCKRIMNLAVNWEINKVFKEYGRNVTMNSRIKKKEWRNYKKNFRKKKILEKNNRKIVG